jgi:hypothetical protein
MLIIISYKLEKLIFHLKDRKEQVIQLLSDINQKIIKYNSETKYQNEIHFKELKSDILHNAAEFHRLREALKAKEEEELSKLSLGVVAQGVKRKRPRREGEDSAPPKAGPKTFDTPS